MTDKKMTLRDTITPKSDQLNYDDVMDKPITVEVTGGKLTDSPDQPLIVNVKNARTGEQMRDYKPCKSMRRVMINVWGESKWTGKRMTLYGDPNVKWAGQSVGGIRISHMSDIEKPVDIMLTATRGKRAPFRVEPLVEEVEA